MRLLVFGGRDFHDAINMARVLDELHAARAVSILIHGGARGADLMAGEWAKQRGIHVAEVCPIWVNYGPTAGPKRNEAMLLLQPEYAVGFPGGRGTADMTRRVRAAGIPLWLPLG